MPPGGKILTVKMWDKKVSLYFKAGEYPEMKLLNSMVDAFEESTPGIESVFVRKECKGTCVKFNIRWECTIGDKGIAPKNSSARAGAKQ
jgi:hypothetical protein